MTVTRLRVLLRASLVCPPRTQIQLLSVSGPERFFVWNPPDWPRYVVLTNLGELAAASEAEIDSSVLGSVRLALVSRLQDRLRR